MIHENLCFAGVVQCELHQLDFPHPLQNGSKYALGKSNSNIYKVGIGL